MKYLIGIDGGGTKTECALAELSGEVLHCSFGKPSNFLAIGIDAAVENLFHLIEGSLFKIEADFTDVKAIVIGTAGAGREEDVRLLESSLNKFASKEGIHINSVKVVSDSRIALEGAFSGRAGCILISGTGSILFAKDKNGLIHRNGGFGRMIGDEGSGYSIGRKGLAVVAKEFDGRGKSTLITQLLNKKFGISSAPDLITNIYKHNFDVASVAEMVLTAADKNDAIAMQILNEEADDLLLHITAAIKKMKVKKLDIAFSGSLIAKKNIYSDTLRNKIADSLSSVKIKEPINSPVEGAILLAKELLNA